MGARDGRDWCALLPESNLYCSQRRSDAVRTVAKQMSSTYCSSSRRRRRTNKCAVVFRDGDFCVFSLTRNKLGLELREGVWACLPSSSAQSVRPVESKWERDPGEKVKVQQQLQKSIDWRKRKRRRRRRRKKRSSSSFPFPPPIPSPVPSPCVVHIFSIAMRWWLFPFPPSSSLSSLACTNPSPSLCVSVCCLCLWVCTLHSCKMSRSRSVLIEARPAWKRILPMDHPQRE